MRKLLLSILLLTSCLSGIKSQTKMAISDVIVKKPYYVVLDERGKKISEKHISMVGELLGFSDEIIVIKSKPYYRIYDANFKKISEKHIAMTGEFKNVVGDKILFIKGFYTHTYDKNFKKINERHN